MKEAEPTSQLCVFKKRKKKCKLQHSVRDCKASEARVTLKHWKVHLVRAFSRYLTSYNTCPALPIKTVTQRKAGRKERQFSASQRSRPYGSRSPFSSLLCPYLISDRLNIYYETLTLSVSGRKGTRRRLCTRRPDTRNRMKSNVPCRYCTSQSAHAVTFSYRTRVLC